MRVKVKPALIGQRYVARSGSHYQLPRGIEEGLLVNVLGHDAGYVTVETADGRQFECFVTCLETGWEYEIEGRWLPAEDPRVRRLKCQGGTAFAIPPMRLV